MKAFAGMTVVLNRKYMDSVKNAITLDALPLPLTPPIAAP